MFLWTHMCCLSHTQPPPLPLDHTSSLRVTPMASDRDFLYIGHDRWHREGKLSHHSIFTFTAVHCVVHESRCQRHFPRFFFEPEQFFVFWKGTGLIFNSLKQIMRILIKTCKWSHKKPYLQIIIKISMNDFKALTEYQSNII